MLNSPFRRRPLIEELEPRILFSADLAPLALDNTAPAPELAHWLKGAAGSVGFDVFTEPARKLEQLAKTHNDAGVNEVVSELHDLVARIDWPRTIDDDALSDTASASEKT